MEEYQTLVTLGLVCGDSGAISTAGSLALSSYKGERITVLMGSERCMKIFTSLKKNCLRSSAQYLRVCGHVISAGKKKI